MNSPKSTDCKYPVVIFIATLTAGGAERVASILANTWATFPDAAVTVITMFGTPHFYPISASVRTLSLGLEQPLSQISAARGLLKLRRLLLTIRPKWIISFMNKYTTYCVLAMVCTKIPVIAAERDSPYERLGWGRQTTRNWAYRRCAGLLVQSRAALEFFAAILPNIRIRALLNPVEQHCSPTERRPQNIVLCASRLVAKKGHSDLLEAFAVAAPNNWTLSILGDGPLRSDLQALAERLRIRSRVQFHGLIRNVGSHLSTAGIFVLPSYWEGFPNALAEAMVAGVPSISYDCQTGPAEMMRQPNSGILVPLGDVKALASSIAALTSNPELRKRISEEAVKLATEVRTDIVATQYWDFCISVTS